MCLSACVPSPTPTPPPTPPSAGPVVINGSALGTRFDGIWAMSANGAAQQLFEYPEPTRSQLLDLFFSAGMGTRWQALKVEIGGDVESSCEDVTPTATAATAATPATVMFTPSVCRRRIPHSMQTVR